MFGTVLRAKGLCSLDISRTWASLRSSSSSSSPVSQWYERNSRRLLFPLPSIPCPTLQLALIPQSVIDHEDDDDEDDYKDEEDKDKKLALIG
jgi:hypothetical protein